MRFNGPNECMGLGMSKMHEAIRPASTVVLWRNGADGLELLMGQRGSSAIFMPSKHVFPGGAVDPVDHTAPLDSDLGADCAHRLSAFCSAGAPPPSALVAAALRELGEETGLETRPSPKTEPHLQFIFRAITPPGRSRRFDARFFLMGAAAVAGPSEDFARASGELTHLHWIGIKDARSLDLPFITEVVIAEVNALLNGRSQPGVPFFDNRSDVPMFRRII